MSDKVMVPGALPGLMREATEIESLLAAEVASLREALRSSEERAKRAEGEVEEWQRYIDATYQAAGMMSGPKIGTTALGERFRELTAEVERLSGEKAHLVGVVGTLQNGFDGQELEIARLKEQFVWANKNTDNCRADASRMGDRALAAESSLAAFRSRCSALAEKWEGWPFYDPVARETRRQFLEDLRSLLASPSRDAEPEVCVGPCCVMERRPDGSDASPRPAVTSDAILSENRREVRCHCGMHHLGEVPDVFSGRWHGVTKCDP